MTPGRIIGTILVLGTCACGGGSGDDDDTVDAAVNADARVVELSGNCPLDTRVGLFEIAHRKLYSAVTGDVTNAVIPLTVLQPAESEGDCQLFRRVNPFCDPPCTGGDVCNQDQVCVPFPSKQNAGPVTITGLTAALVLDPDVTNHYETTDVDRPPFTAGTPILLHAAGDQVPAFDLDGIGVAPLVVDDPSWTLVDGEPLEITWTAASGDWRILATLNVDQHGNSPVTMYCDLPDTGSATIPAALLATLVGYGTSGAYTGHLFRRTVDSVSLPTGCVELDVFSHVQAQLAAE